MPEGGPAPLTQKPSAGTSWDYKLEGESRDLWLPRLNISLCPWAWPKQGARQGEQPRLSAAAPSHSAQLPQLNANPLPHEYSSPSWASMDMKVQMNSS